MGKSSMKTKIIFALIFTLFLTSLSYAEETVVFGPETFKGRLFVPKTTIAEFPIEDTTGEFTLIIENGMEFIPKDCSLEPTNRLKRRCAFINFFNGLKAKFSRAIDAEIILNDDLIVESGEINNNVEYLEVPVDVQEGDNELVVTVQGFRKSFLQLTIFQAAPVDPCGIVAEPCPCDYDLTPKTTDCWESCQDCTGNPHYTTTQPPTQLCTLFQDTTTPTEASPNLAILAITGPFGSTGMCGTGNDPTLNPTCTQSDTREEHFDLTPGEIASCQCRLEQYTKALIQAGIIVIDGQTGPPLTVDQVTCPAPLE